MGRVFLLMILLAAGCNLVRAGDLDRYRNTDLALAYQVGLSLGSVSTNPSLVDGVTVTDNGDGSAYVLEHNLTWATCIHGLSGPACGTGAAVLSLTYCSPADNSCNGGPDTGTLGSSGTSTLYSACANFALGGRAWRVPSAGEYLRFYHSVGLLYTDIFPLTGFTAASIWTASSLSASMAAQVAQGGDVTGITKTVSGGTRCVSDGK